MLNLEITVGNLLTIATIIISIATLLYSLQKDREMRQREQADRIRKAAGIVAAKLERWVELSLRIDADVQPLLTDVDALFFEKQNKIIARDFLWKGLVTAQARATERIVDEEIEIAYSDLYGYAPSIQELYSNALTTLRKLQREFYDLLLSETQDNLMELAKLEDLTQYHSAQLGNKLRATCARLERTYREQLTPIVLKFRDEVVRLIEASDEDILSRKVSIRVPTRQSSASSPLDPDETPS